jgi:hypothetical protein
VSDAGGAIRDLVANWAIWRDAGDWDRFATVWQDDGVMMATWFQGPAADQRTTVDDVECDVVCTGRFYDFLKLHAGRWGIVLRQPIYEQDRLTPVSGGPGPRLDRSLLDQFPIGYRHLAYIQTQIGYDVKRDMPGLTGPEVEDLYRRGTEWLAG